MKNIFYNGDTNNNIIDRVSFVQSLKSGMNAMDVIEALLAFKPSDAVPVVRCKDCYRSYEDIMLDGYVCCDRLNGLPFKCDDFCSYGERKEEK